MRKAFFYKTYDGAGKTCRKSGMTRDVSNLTSAGAGWRNEWSGKTSDGTGRT
jgi:hypothetical protein